MSTFSQIRFDAQKPNEDWTKQFFIQSGCLVIPFTDFANGSAPMCDIYEGKDILPDYQIFDYQQNRTNNQIFVEVKTAEKYPYNRTYNARVLGIKKYQWSSYMDIYKKTKIDILFIWFVANKYVLTSQISRMQPLSCLCGNCRKGLDCYAEGLVYFKVETEDANGCIHLNKVLTKKRYY